MNNTNPFVGLRPFSKNESHLFFGREEQIEEVIHKLQTHRFAAILGNSGAGKSSFVYCSLLPKFESGFEINDRKEWNCITFYPGTTSPFCSLFDALQILDKEERQNFTAKDNYALLKEKILASPSIDSQKNTLFFIDQFEEIFRVNDKNEITNFLHLIGDLRQDTENPFFVLITIRSDLVGYCSNFPDFTRILNKGQYLMPKMTREQRRRTIVKPIELMNATISDKLVERLLDNQDIELPVMQHALMRTWDDWSELNSKRAIDELNYDNIGTTTNAISIHANEIFNQLDSEEQIIAEKIFRCLSILKEDKQVRNPMTLSDIKEIIGTDDSTMIIKVIDAFRQNGRSFLIPHYNIELNDNSIVDIVHESLIRIWDAMATWIGKEQESVKQYVRLAERALLYQEGKAPLLKGAELKITIAWREEQNPSGKWAVQHHPAYETAMLFLKHCEEEEKKEDERKTILKKKQTKIQRIMAFIFFIIGVAGVFLAINASKESRIAALAKNEAVKSAETAEKQKQKAIKAQEAAEIQKQKAVKSAEVATEKEKEAQRQKELANVEKQKAVVSARIAVEKTEIALEKTEIALEKTKEAEKANKKAESLRVLSIAQSMAVKSLQITKDTVLKSLIAYQGYLLNKQHGGLVHNPDLYNALYEANKLEKGEDANISKKHFGAVRSVSFAPTGKTYYTTGSDGKIFKYELNSEEPPVLITQTGGINRIITVSPQNKWLACGQENGNIVLKSLTSENTLTFTGNRKPIMFLEFTDDTQILSLSDNKLTAWEVNTSEASILADSLQDAKGFKYISAQQKIYFIQKNQLISLHISTGKIEIVYTSNSPGREFVSMTVSPQNSYKAIGDIKGTIYVFNQNNKLIRLLKMHDARVNDIAFSPSENLMASAGFDGIIQMWDVKQLDNPPIKIKDNTEWIWSVDFSNDGKYLISGHNNGSIKKWATSTLILAQQLKPHIKRNFTEDEWNRYIADDIVRQKTIEDFKLP